MAIQWTQADRNHLAAVAGIEAWQAAVALGRAVKEAFEDQGMRATESEISLGLQAVREFRSSPHGKEAIAAALSIRI